MPEKQSIKLYCNKEHNSDNGKTTYHNFHETLIPFTSGVVCRPRETVYEIELEICDEKEHDYIAWQETNPKADGTPNIPFIFRKRIELSACFTYGLDKAIKTGMGKVVWLKTASVKELGTAESMKYGMIPKHR